MTVVHQRNSLYLPDDDEDDNEERANFHRYFGRQDTDLSRKRRRSTSCFGRLLQSGLCSCCQRSTYSENTVDPHYVVTRPSTAVILPPPPAAIDPPQAPILVEPVVSPLHGRAHFLFDGRGLISLTNRRHTAVVAPLVQVPALEEIELQRNKARIGCLETMLLSLIILSTTKTI